MIPFIRLEHDESIDARKNILASQIGLLNISKRLYAYKKLRKLELTKKSMLKGILRQTVMKTSSLLEYLPKDSSIKIKTEKPLKQVVVISNNKDSKKSRDIETQLQEIKERLSRL